MSGVDPGGESGNHRGAGSGDVPVVAGLPEPLALLAAVEESEGEDRQDEYHDDDDDGRDDGGVGAAHVVAGALTLLHLQSWKKKSKPWRVNQGCIP